MSNKGRSRRRIEERYSYMDGAVHMPNSDSETSDIVNDPGVSTCDMDTRHEGNRGRRRHRGGKGRENKQTTSSCGPETRSSNSRKDNPAGVDTVVTNGSNAEATVPGPSRQTNDKPKSKKTGRESQTKNTPASTSRRKTSLPLARVASADVQLHSSTPNNDKADFSRQTRQRHEQIQDLLRQKSSQRQEQMQSNSTVPRFFLPIHNSVPTNKTRAINSSTTEGDLCRQELVSDIVNIIVANGGSIQISSLRKTNGNLYDGMVRLCSGKTVRGFIQDYIRVLRGSPETGTVNVLTFSSDLEICKVHGHTAGSCYEFPNECRSLHICKYQMMNQCTRGKKCLFGHSLRNSYNKSVLKYHFMEKVSDEGIRKFLSSLDNRRGLTVPGICSYYNSSKGCQKSGNCSFLHICKHYIRGDCRFDGKCSYSHDSCGKQPQCILGRYGLSGAKFTDLQKIIVAELREADYSSCEEDSSSLSDEYNSDNIQIKDDGGPTSKLHSDYNQMCRQLGRADRNNQPEDVSDSFSDDQGSDASSNEHNEDTDVRSEKDSDISSTLPTVNKGLHCLPAWTCETTYESRHPLLDVAAHNKEENGDITGEISVQIPSPMSKGDMQPQVTHRVPGFDHCWRVSTVTDGTAMELTAREHQELEFLYETYLRAKQCAMSLNGRSMTVNFETMSGSVKTGEDDDKLVIRRDPVGEYQ